MSSRMNGIVILILVILAFMLMFNKTVRKYIKEHRELVLAIFYTILAIWLSILFLRPNNFKVIFKYMKTNVLYVIYIIIYVAIPTYYIYLAVKEYINLYNRIKNKDKEEIAKEKPVSKNNKKKKNHK